MGGTCHTAHFQAEEAEKEGVASAAVAKEQTTATVASAKGGVVNAEDAYCGHHCRSDHDCSDYASPPNGCRMCMFTWGFGNICSHPYDAGAAPSLRGSPSSEPATAASYEVEAKTETEILP